MGYKQMTKTEYWKHLIEQGVPVEEIMSIITNLENKGVWK